MRRIFWTGVVMLLCTATLLSQPPMNTRVRGYVWTSADAPVSTTVQVRNMLTGAIAGSTHTDAAGAFEFLNLPPGTYVLEQVESRRVIQILGSPFTIRHGDTLMLFLRLSTAAPVAALTGNIAAAVLQAAGTVGVTRVVTTGLPPASAIR